MGELIRYITSKRPFSKRRASYLAANVQVICGPSSNLLLSGRLRHKNPFCCGVC